MEEKYRHELKYEISYGEYLQLLPRVSAVMKRDAHILANGSYQICSLYYDNCYDKALHEKLSGVNRRDKFRIRFYNGDFSFIALEKKSKHDNLCLKKTCRITEAECRRLVAGDVSWAEQQPDRPLLEEFSRAVTADLMRPKTIVSYVRIPFVYEAGNVRVTFDTDIRSGLFHADLFDSPHPLISAEPDGKMVLEIKYDEFIPDVIRMIIQTGIPRLQAFSKYACCRQYE